MLISKTVKFVMLLLWLVRSSHLGLLDFFLWGYVKDEEYKSIPSNIEEIKQEYFENVLVVKNEN